MGAGGMLLERTGERRACLYTKLRLAPEAVARVQLRIFFAPPP